MVDESPIPTSLVSGAGDSGRFKDVQGWVRTPALPLTSWVTLGESFPLSVSLPVLRLLLPHPSSFPEQLPYAHCFLSVFSLSKLMGKLRLRETPAQTDITQLGICTAGT
jgi:hypothetical protein